MNDVIEVILTQKDTVTEKDIEKMAAELNTCQNIIHRLDNLDDIT